ncbi:unnamed protein product [Cylindrotheca closterium]|uniref:Uncharacterized protein n=1 Tax=Cylindrotheca closterium TaxID=2856 RepID=A0AAD2CIN2_9STRA|nr:unnamed protein product [Cylindrotheca closterium]
MNGVVKIPLTRRRSNTSVGSSGSQESDHSLSHPNVGTTSNALQPPILVYHESARSIVFRDHLRRTADIEQSEGGYAASSSPEPSPTNNNLETKADHEHFEEDYSMELSVMNALFGGSGSGGLMSERITIQGFTPNIVPLPLLELGPNDEFLPLLDSHDRNLWTSAEREVVDLLDSQCAVVKTIKNNDWTDFLHRFKSPHPPKGQYPDDHNDIPPNGDYKFNSFVTSTTLLPAGGKKMRCYGAAAVYTSGIVFALPKFPDAEAENKKVESTRTWSWPSGYSAKTEFNVDSRGNLINGRQEALVPLSTLREYNNDYLTKEDYMIAGRVVKGGLQTVPYNEAFVRVGGVGRLVNGKDVASGLDTRRSLEKGVGLPVALFVRTATFGHLISLLRTRARLMHVWGQAQIQDIPLLYISPAQGIRVLTAKLQHELLQIASRGLNPFQNPLLHKTTIDNTDEKQLETKLEELIDLDGSIREMLTPGECVRLAGGFGATDESIAQILNDAMIQDKNSQLAGELKSESHRLQDIVNEGLAHAVRSGDYYTSRQLLILYTLVASEGHQMDADEKPKVATLTESGPEANILTRTMSLDSGALLLKRQAQSFGLTINAENSILPPRPPPPPLDTDRLRSATNSDGLLAVLGAAQVLKSMRDGSAKRHTEESFLAVEEWCEYAEQSMAFRLASWRDQRAAQGDLKIAFQKDSSFMAFVSNKAISNRKSFAKQLRDAAKQTDFSDVRFLTAIFEMISKMHSPCLRLELLQFVLGLDNRYSIAHVKRSVELAATCLSISASTTV